MNILLADDHPLVRDGLKMLLAELDKDAHVIEAADYAELVEKIEQYTEIDLVLLDLEMPGKHESPGISALCERLPGSRVVVLSASDDPLDIRAALDQGACGYIPKSSGQTVTLRALELVMSGGSYLPEALLSRPARASPADQAPAYSGRLTQRQVEVLRLLARGKTNKTIARDLGISDATVRTHVTAIFKILEVSNRTEAVRTGMSLGFVSISDE